MKIRKFALTLNGIWRKCGAGCLHAFTIDYILNAFGYDSRPEGLLGVFVSKKGKLLTDCVSFYGMYRRQERALNACRPSVHTCVPALITEYIIVARRYDNGIVRRKEIIIAE